MYDDDDHAPLMKCNIDFVQRPHFPFIFTHTTNITLACIALTLTAVVTN